MHGKKGILLLAFSLFIVPFVLQLKSIPSNGQWHERLPLRNLIREQWLHHGPYRVGQLPHLLLSPPLWERTQMYIRTREPLRSHPISTLRLFSFCAFKALKKVAYWTASYLHFFRLQIKRGYVLCEKQKTFASDRSDQALMVESLLCD